MTEDKKLTEKQLRFCQEYINDLNATQAAIRAGYSAETARSIASENLSKLNIRSKIDELKQLRSSRTEITSDKVLYELSKIGFSDIRGLFSDGGDLKNINDLDDEISSCVQSFEVVVRPIQDEFGNKSVEHVAKMKMLDKVRALELMGRHLKLFTDKQEIESKNTVKIIDLTGKNEPDDS